MKLHPSEEELKCCSEPLRSLGAVVVGNELLYASVITLED